MEEEKKKESGWPIEDDELDNVSGGFRPLCIYQFDAYCKRTLRNERIDYYRQKQYRMKHEVFLSELEGGYLKFIL